jgi:hypothetical protein
LPAIDHSLEPRRTLRMHGGSGEDERVDDPA